MRLVQCTLHRSHAIFRHMHTFQSMGLHPLTMRAITDDFKYSEMSAVQHKVLVERDRDLLVRAKTGTGKTLAFMIHAVEHSIKLHSLVSGSTPIVVITPTRELASQICQETSRLLKHHRMPVALVVGGTPRAKSLRELEMGASVIVATPGRFLDILNSSHIVAKKVFGAKVLVLDEADQLLEMGFKREMEEIVRCVLLVVIAKQCKLEMNFCFYRFAITQCFAIRNCFYNFHISP